MAANTASMELPRPHFGTSRCVVITQADGVTIAEHLSDYEAAQCRVLNQDTLFLHTWLQQNVISATVHSQVLTQFSICFGLTNERRQTLAGHGLQLCRRYTSLTGREQLRWLLEDLSIRQSLKDYGIQYAPMPQPPGCMEAMDRVATQTRLHVNHLQMKQLQDVLFQHPRKEIEDIAALVGPRQSMLAQACPARNVRHPLAPLAPNMSIQPDAASSQSLKRSRGVLRPVKASDVISLYSESDDEDALQSKANAIQAKIAAIKARTSDEDLLMPSQRTKRAKLTDKQSMVHRPSSAAGATSGIGGILSTGLGAATTMQTAGTARIKQETVLKDISEMDDTQHIRLVIKARNRKDFRVKVSPGTQIAKLIKAAKRTYSLSPEQTINLRFDGEALAPSSLIRDAGLEDMDILELHGASSAGLPPNRPSMDGLVPAKPNVVTEEHVRIQKSFDWHNREYLNPQGSMTPRNEAQERYLATESRSARPTASQPIDLTSSSPKSSSKTTRPTAFHHSIDLTSSSPAPPQSQVPPPTPAPLPAKTEPELCTEQQYVVDLIMQRHNVFYTGSAGCGKSTVLKAFVSQLRDQGKTVRIVAPTGKAALDINGSTTWTYAGWTPGHMKRPLDELVKLAHGKFVSKRFRDTDVLVIDEISMVESDILTRLSHIMQAARGNGRPFGGVQLVVTGDFCQLPPVKPFQCCISCGRERIQKIGPAGEILYRCTRHGDCNDNDKWAFRSAVWEACNFRHVNLTNIHRQSDEVFIKILQKLRVGIPLTNADRNILQDHPCDVTNAVKLYPTREEVRRINQTEFDKLRTEKRSYQCLDYFSWNEQHGNLREKGRRSPRDGSLEALREHKLDTMVEFKAGMLVVLLVNLDIANGLVNGSQGRVIGFEPYDPAKLPKATVFPSGGDSFSSTQRGGGRKSSSKGGRGRESSMGPPEVQGELRGEYAALREGLIKDFIQQDCNKHKMWPIVDFGNGIKRTIYADCQVNELGDEKPYTLLARTQVPLLAAWAMTIHKSQGMTLNRVIVDLGKSFEEGQEYVALSRARSLHGLKVESLGANVGKGGNEQVKKFLQDKFGIQ